MHPPIDGSRRTTMAAGAFFGLLAGAGGAILQRSEAAYAGMAMPGDPGPFFLARLCLWIIGLAGLVLFATGILGRAAPDSDTAETQPRAERAGAWFLAAAFTLSLAAMPWAMRSFGTTEAVAAFSVPWIAVLLALRDGPGWRSLAAAVGFGLAAAAFVHLVFVRLLTLPLPG